MSAFNSWKTFLSCFDQCRHSSQDTVLSLTHILFSLLQHEEARRVTSEIPSASQPEEVPLKPVTNYLFEKMLGRGDQERNTHLAARTTKNLEIKSCLSARNPIRSRRPEYAMYLVDIVSDVSKENTKYSSSWHDFIRGAESTLPPQMKEKSSCGSENFPQRSAEGPLFRAQCLASTFTHRLAIAHDIKWCFHCHWHLEYAGLTLV